MVDARGRATATVQVFRSIRLTGTGIIAGTGAASGGQFHGVAPDATLLNGRICDLFGCPDSAILAAMEWAVVTEHARIVNVSLGGPDSPGSDPIEDAVNQLSAQYGTLFVIAAGNAGPGPQTVSSPGSADAALTVGAVDRTDQLAEFSGEGPRIGDHAIKPDITAPGVDITAARAAGTQLGPPVGNFYVMLSGTSMATPHVAGSAALLLQQHPDWAGDRLKAELIGTAQPNDALTVYQQGSGRVDVDRATRQAVNAGPASLSLGIAQFPHDDDLPITQTVRYLNGAADPVTLTLAATLSTGGIPAPPGMLAIAPSVITVAPGDAAEIAVTIDTRVDAADGACGGTLVASSDAIRVITPIGVEREVESYDLTVGSLGRDGSPSESLISLFGVGDPGDPVRNVALFDVDVPDQATFRVPRGTYTVGSLLVTENADDQAWLIAPRVAVAADTRLVMDGQVARPVDLTLPQRDLVFFQGLWDFEDPGHEISMALLGTPRLLATGEIGPGAPPGEVHSLVNVVFASDPGQPADVFNLERVVRDHFLTGWKQVFQPGDFATVQSSHAGAAGDTLVKVTAPIPNADGFFLGADFFYSGPFRRTDHTYGPDSQWLEEFFAPDRLQDAIVNYTAGQRSFESWNQAPFGPAFSGPTLLSVLVDGTGAPARNGDRMVFAPSMFSDRSEPAHMGLAAAETRLTLSQNGQILADTTSPSLASLLVTVSPDPGQYRLEADATQPGDVFDLSTHVAAAWTFRSQHVAGATQHLPLPTLRFLPELDEHNQSAARVQVLPIRIERPVGAPAPRITRAHVEASFDDGATWVAVPIVRLGDAALGLIVPPRGTRYVSLRGGAADVDGNTVEQTIIRAYAISPR